MRTALVTPYSWTYGGGVNRHVESLAGALARRGHEVSVLAPWDPPGRISRLAHRAEPAEREMPDYLVPLGRTIGVNANGAVSNLGGSPSALVRLRRARAAGSYDVVHVHEPIAPFIGPDACSWRGAPGRPHERHLAPFPRLPLRLRPARVPNSRR